MAGIRYMGCDKISAELKIEAAIEKGGVAALQNLLGDHDGDINY